MRQWKLSSIVTGIRSRLEALVAAPTVGLRRFVVDGDAIGWIDDARASRLEAFSDTLVVAHDHIRFVDALDSHGARSDAMERVTRTLSSEGLLSAWRGERYAVARAFGVTPSFDLERSAARYFGIRTYAAHVNGAVSGPDGGWLWFARRSPGKAIDPGMLDNLVGGGIEARMSTAETVLKEAWEEAGIPADVAATATPVAEIRICRSHPLGLERETVFAHDLMLAPEFKPVAIDGEVVEFRRVNATEAAALIANREGPDVVTADASLVVVDWLLRSAALPMTEGDRGALRRLCSAALDF